MNIRKWPFVLASIAVILVLASCGESAAKPSPSMAGYILKEKAILTKESRDDEKGTTQYTNVEYSLVGCAISMDKIEWTSKGTVMQCSVACPADWDGEKLAALMMGVSIEGQLPGAKAVNVTGCSKQIDIKHRKIRITETLDIPGEDAGKKMGCILVVEYSSELNGSKLALNKPVEVSNDETAAVTPVKQYIQSGTFTVVTPG